MKPNEENLIWEAYVTEANHDDVNYSGDESVHDLAKVEPIELDDERGELDDEDHEYEEGDLVALTKAAGGGQGKIVELSPAGTHAIIELIKGQTETDLEEGDRVSVHVGDLLMLPETLEDEEDWEDDVSMEGCGCAGPEEAPIIIKKRSPKAKLPKKLRAIIIKKIG